MSSAIGGLLGGVGGGRREDGAQGGGGLSARIARVTAVTPPVGEGFDGGETGGQLVTLGAQEGQGLPHHLPVAVAGLVYDVVHPGGVERVTVLLLDDAAEGPCAALGAPQLLDEAEDRGGVHRSNELGVLVGGEGVREDGSRRARNLLPVAVTVCGPRPWCGCLSEPGQVVDPVTHRLFSLSVR